jgi:hypothetical protein
MSRPLGPLARFLLWDYERGGLAYDLLCVLMALLVFFLPDPLLRDPMRLPR